LHDRKSIDSSTGTISATDSDFFHFFHFFNFTFAFFANTSLSRDRQKIEENTDIQIIQDVVVRGTLPEFWKRWLLATRTTEFTCSRKRFIATGKPACIDSRPIFLENLLKDYKY